MKAVIGGAFSLLVISTLTACGSDAGESGGTGAASTGGGGGNSASGAGGGLHVDGAAGTGASSGCSKTDFLFVVDNSVSMEGEQAELGAAFPAFIASIQSATAIESFHIMVVDTDAETRCTAEACAGSKHSTCDAYACANVYTGCDATRGAGVIQPTGQASSNQVCPLANGRRYMTEGQPELAASFSCVATLGLSGNASERPMESMVAAVSPALQAAGGCNEGFLRDDAILVVTFISDDPNKEDQGTPKQWYDAMVAAKGGNADAVVMLGLIPDGAAAAPSKQPHWHEFLALWGGRGFKGDVAAPDYSPFFDAAIAIIDDACDGFVKPH